MYWADELAAAVSGRQVVNDSKTPSGTIHVGALRGVVIHDAIVRALRQAGHEARFVFGIDDLDPMDSQTLATREGRLHDMGKPLARIPPPAGSEAPSWAHHFARGFVDTFAHVGAHPELYWMSELYAQGVFDAFIAEALDHAARVRKVYADVSHSIKPADWYPLQVICPDCGKVGTTRVTGWDGREVMYTCLPDLVEWATGCGRAGSISPFGGNAKLPWNLDWVAQWRHFGVTIEGCGKDLSTAGGSRERSDALARRVFGFEPPLNVPYEFLLVGGRKMKSSMGTGAAAHAMADLLPGELLRFLMLRHRPNHAIDFDPSGDTVPRLFDEFDRIALAAVGREVKGELPPDPDRIFRASLLDPQADPVAEGARFRPPFGHLTFLVQVPEVDLRSRMEAEKGSPLDEVEWAILEDRVRVAETWLADFAPERARIAVQREALPAEATALGDEQRLYLGALALRVTTERPLAGDAWQELIFRVAEEAALPAGRAFAAIYLAFLGRTNGPRAGWLLASLEPESVVARLREAAGWGPDDEGPGPVPARFAGKPPSSLARKAGR